VIRLREVETAENLCEAEDEDVGDETLETEEEEEEEEDDDEVVEEEAEVEEEEAAGIFDVQRSRFCVCFITS